MKKIYVLICLTFVIVSCKKEIELDFIEDSIETSEAADIAINIPKAKGNDDLAKLINTTISNYIIEQSSFAQTTSKSISLEDALTQFNTEFKTFKTNFPESSQKWEYFVDGDLLYFTDDLICIVLTSYLDTGGAHGNTNVRFFNFDPQNVKVFSTSELLEDSVSFSKVVEQKLMDNLKSESQAEPIENFFFGEGFKLPETLGFNEEGIVILYNPYEIASYAQGILEFTILYDEIEEYLRLF